MGVLEAWCNYPDITKSDIRGRRKPQAYVNGADSSDHDVNALKILNGTGVNSDVLGVAPRTASAFWPFCSDPVPLLDARQGDVVFSLRAYSDHCRITGKRAR